MYIDLKRERQTKWAFFLASVFSLGMFPVLQALFPCGMMQKLYPGFPVLSNVVAYVLTLFLFVATFCAGFVFFQFVTLEKLQTKLDRTMDKKMYTVVFVIGSGMILVLLALRRLFTETTEFGAFFPTISFHRLPGWPGYLLFLAMAAFAVLAGLKLHKGRDLSRRTFCLCCGGVLLMNFAAALVMNTFHADIHHGVAYVESVYNVYYGVPYTDITSGIYGYFGLFLAPVLHIFGGSSFALMITIALLECLVTVLCLYCICAVTEENYFRLMALVMCCFSIFSMRVKNYWQVQPHRVLWPLILAAYVLYLVKKNRWHLKDKILGYILCIGAVVWNVESGLFCSVAFAAACVINHWQQRLWYSPQSLLKCLLHAGCVAGTVVAAIGIVNGYNYLCGSRQPFLTDFFFPMFETSYMTGFLEVDMPIGNHAWVYVLILFGGLLLGALYETSFIQGKNVKTDSKASQMAPAVMAVAMLGLCSFSYYANRAAYFNLDIIVQLASIATCMVWARFRRNLFSPGETWSDCGKAVLAYVSYVLTLVLAIESLVFSVPLLQDKAENRHYDTGSYRQACELLRETVPENTFAFGGGISMLYADLGWDTVGHYRDMSDLLVGGDKVVGCIVDDALCEDAFVAYLSTGKEQEIVEQILALKPEFKLTAEAELNGKTMQYYTCIGGRPSTDTIKETENEEMEQQN